MNQPTSLSALLDLATHRHATTSGRALERIAQAAGHQIVHTTINGIRKGTYKSEPSDDTIRAIAWLAGVSDHIAFEVAGRRPPGPPFSAELPPGVDQLSPKERKLAIEVLRAMVTQRQEINHLHRELGIARAKATIHSGNFGVIDAVVLQDNVDDQHMVAYITTGPTFRQDRLAGALQQQGLDVELVTLDEFPVTPNGKLDGRRLEAARNGGAEQPSAHAAPARKIRVARRPEARSTPDAVDREHDQPPFDPSREVYAAFDPGEEKPDDSTADDGSPADAKAAEAAAVNSPDLEAFAKGAGRPRRRGHLPNSASFPLESGQATTEPNR